MTHKKLAILLPSLGGGGAERLSLELAKQFTHMGVTCSFIVAQKAGELVEEAESIADVHDLGAKRILDVARSLPRMVARTRPDAVISNIWPLTAVSAVALRRVSKAMRPRLLLTEHAMLSNQYAEWSMKTRIGLRASQIVATRLADIRIGVSQAVAEDWANLAQMNPAQFSVVHNPVPQLTAPSSEERRRAKEMWGPKRGRRIISVGNLKKVKNHGLMIEAFAKIHTPNDKLIILGEGDQRNALERQIKDLGLTEDVLLPGFCANPTSYYETADLFAMTSTSEGFGNVLVEAMHAGLPIVSTDCPGGPAHILNGGEFGALVPLGDVSALSQAMEHSLRNRRPADVLKNRAKEFSVKKAADAYLSLAFPSDAA